MPPYGSFGCLAEAYEKGRKSYPWPVIRKTLELIPKRSKILDLGCGTGIASRALQAGGMHVIGCDLDLAMTAKAVFHPKVPVPCAIAPAEDLPFRSGTFRLVTAFASFHWFCHEKETKEISKVVAEIRRVLVSHGAFITVNRENFGREILEAALGESLPRIKNNHNPSEILGEYGFQTETILFKTIETYTLQEFLWYMRSISHWNLVPIPHRRFVLSSLRDQFAARAKCEVFSHETRFRMCIGKK